MDRDLSRSRAILIGNAGYQHPEIPDLLAARGCVNAMKELLTGPLCGWPADRVTTLVDLDTSSELASRVVDVLGDVEDVLLLYYVGHGLRTSEGQLALAVGQTNPHPELRAHTGMLYENLAKILRGCRATTKLVILDCCHAELGNKVNYLFQSADLADAYPVDGLYFIGASARDKLAKTPLDGELTYFTDALITVVNEGIPRRPAELRLDQIFLEVRARLLRANRSEPVESGIRGAYQYPFARNAAPPESHIDPATEEPPSPGVFGRATADSGSPKALFSRRRVLAAGAGAVAVGAATGAVELFRFNSRGTPPRTRNTGKSAGSAGRALNVNPFLAPINCSGPVLCVAFSLDGHTIASGNRNDAIQFWDVNRTTAATALGETSVTGHSTSTVNSVAFSSDPSLLASGTGSDAGSPDNRIELWKISDDGYPTKYYRPHGAPRTKHVGAVNSVAFSRGGNLIADGGNDSMIILQDIALNSFQIVKTDSTLVEFVYSVKFSPDGQFLASAVADSQSDDSFILLWDVSKGLSSVPARIDPPLRGHASAVNTVAFALDGRALASGSNDGTILLWDVHDWRNPSGDPIGPALDAHAGNVFSVAYSAKHGILASGHQDGNVRLWNVHDPARLNPNPIRTLTGHTDRVNSVQFSSDGTILAAGSDDSTIRLWKIS